MGIDTSLVSIDAPGRAHERVGMGVATERSPPSPVSRPRAGGDGENYHDGSFLSDVAPTSGWGWFTTNAGGGNGSSLAHAPAGNAEPLISTRRALGDTAGIPQPMVATDDAALGVPPR